MPFLTVQQYGHVPSHFHYFLLKFSKHTCDSNMRVSLGRLFMPGGLFLSYKLLATLGQTKYLDRISRNLSSGSANGNNFNKPVNLQRPF